MLNHICKDLSGKDYVRLIKNVLARRKDSFSGIDSTCPLERNVYTMPIRTEDVDHLAKKEEDGAEAEEKPYDPEEDNIPHAEHQLLDGFDP